MPTLLPTLSEAVHKAVATAVRENDAPLSAWPEVYPGQWATASRICELVGVPMGNISPHLRDLVATGKVRAENVWPGEVRGYQPTAASPETTPLFAIPDLRKDERQWLLDELRRWGETHDGRRPRKVDWTNKRDPAHEWPRSYRLVEFFDFEARENGFHCYEPGWAYALRLAGWSLARPDEPGVNSPAAHRRVGRVSPVGCDTDRMINLPPQTIVELTPAELAEHLLPDLIASRVFNAWNYINEAERGHYRGAPAAAISGALGWLFGQGMIAHSPLSGGSSWGAMVVTPAGHRAAGK